MIIPSGLIEALSGYVAEHVGAMSPFIWKTRDSAWRTLRTGFDHEKYKNDLPRQNIELKLHLARRWAGSSLDERIRLAGWIVKDWGGINRNTAMTILGFVNQAEAERPATPFFGIASYSKIFSIKDPTKYAIFDARVAASLNAIQLLLKKDKKLHESGMMTFSIPQGQNDGVKRFASAFLRALPKLAATPVSRDATYGTYLSAIEAVARNTGNSVLEVEMFLFSQANQLCVEALPFVSA
jgi:hypothetical protein